MAFILPSEYDEIEDRHKALPIASLFDPKLYKRLEWPHRVSSRLQLIDYASEGGLEPNVDLLGELGVLSIDDYSVISWNRDKHIEFQTSFFPDNIAFSKPESYLHYFGQFILIKELLPPCKVIFEIGPGVGHLSAVCSEFLPGLEKYYAFEAVQSNYCWQSCYLSSASNKFKERAFDYRQVSDPKNETAYNESIYLRPGPHVVSKSRPTTLEHLPYWSMAPDYIERIGLETVELVVASGCLNELSIECLHFFLETFRSRLQVGTKLFYQCPGLLYDDRNLMKILFEYGFHLDFHLGYRNPITDFPLCRPIALFTFKAHPFKVGVDDSVLKQLTLGQGTYCSTEYKDRLAAFYRTRHPKLSSS